jgi:hypothetical protein
MSTNEPYTTVNLYYITSIRNFYSKENFSNQSPQSIEENDIFFVYVAPSVAFVGILFEIISILVFSHPDFKSQYLFKYLKVKVYFEMFDLWFGLLRPISDCKGCDTSTTYFSRVFFIMTIVYLASVCETSAILCQILSSLNFYLLVSNKLNSRKWCVLIKFFKKIKLVCCLIVLFGLILFSYQLAQYEIIEKAVLDEAKNVSKIIYIQTNRPFNDHIIKTVLEVVTFFIRDFVCLVILIIINLKLYLRLRKNIKTKAKFRRQNIESNKMTQNQEIVNNVGKKDIIKLVKFESKMTIMFIVIFINHIFGRMPILLFFIIRNFHDGIEMFYFIRIAVFHIYLSYSISFFFYFFSNKKFKRVFLHYFFIIFKYCQFMQRNNK